MSQYVVQFGAKDVAKLAEIFAHEIAGRKCAIQVLSKENLGTLIYQESPLPLPDALVMIIRGEVVSLIARPSQGALRYGLILPPNFNGQRLSLWSATLEWTDNGWQEAWERLLHWSDLSFITVGFEEGVEVSDECLSVESFPWQAWPTVIAAVRSDIGGQRQWTVRSNPSFPRV